LESTANKALARYGYDEREAAIILDVLLYPTSVPGLVNLLVFWLVLPVHIYSLMISAHLLGRFFFRYEERLNWEA